MHPAIHGSWCRRRRSHDWLYETGAAKRGAASAVVAGCGCCWVGVGVAESFCAPLFFSLAVDGSPRVYNPCAASRNQLCGRGAGTRNACGAGDNYPRENLIHFDNGVAP
jgi:hypothetical protein